MTKTTIQTITIGTTNVAFTLAGIAALLTPLPMKDYITNSRRDENGKEYLLSAAKFDDAQVSVQCMVWADDLTTALQKMQSVVGLFNDGTQSLTIGSLGKFLYKSTGSISIQENGKTILFSLNLIKLAEN